MFSTDEFFIDYFEHCHSQVKFVLCNLIKRNIFVGCFLLTIVTPVLSCAICNHLSNHVFPQKLERACLSILKLRCSMQELVFHLVCFSLSIVDYFEVLALSLFKFDEVYKKNISRPTTPNQFHYTEPDLENGSELNPTSWDFLQNVFPLYICLVLQI